MAKMPLGVTHVRPCIQTLDAYFRCTQCLHDAGREPDCPWQDGDIALVPPQFRTAARVH